MSYDDDEYFDDDENEGGEKKKSETPFIPDYWIKVNGLRAPLKSIFSIEEVDGYDSKKLKPTYKVLINRTDDPKVMNGNKEIVFYDWSDRAVFLEEVDEKLKQCLVEFITIKKEDE